MEHSTTLAYIIGIALGDGNLSCPNGRATRLRITCDTKYPEIINDIIFALELLFPNNTVAQVHRPDHCIDISVYSNTLNQCMPWQVGKGSKHDQNARVPKWILHEKNFTKCCLKGLLQTDGSIYTDRTYQMVNFNNMTEGLVDDVFEMITQLGYSPRKYQVVQRDKKVKYSLRLAKDVNTFLNDICLYKS